MLEAFGPLSLLALFLSALNFLVNCRWCLVQTHFRLTLPVFHVLNLQDFRVFLIVRHHFVCLIKLSIRADGFTVVFLIDQVLRADFVELLHDGGLNNHVSVDLGSLWNRASLEGTIVAMFPDRILNCIPVLESHVLKAFLHLLDD